MGEFSVEKYKKRVAEAVQRKGLYSVMNNTKWRELREAMMREIPFSPPYIVKDIINEKVELPAFDKDVWYIGGWEYENFYPFVGIEWIKIRPRYIAYRGKLIDGEMIDETAEFIEVLEKYQIPYEEENGAYVIYGYKKA